MYITVRRTIFEAMLLVAMVFHCATPPTAYAVVSEPSAAGNALLHAIGWQTFDNATPGNNNSGITDTTPDSNSTFDSTPVGSFAAAAGGGVYLTGRIGPGASILGWDGYGQSTNTSYLQGATFGSSTVGSSPFGVNIEDVPLADGSPGSRLNTQASSGSSWKFRSDGNHEFGDFSITNESDYTFRLERIHYDARVGNVNSPKDLSIVYLASGDSNLVRADDGTEVLDLRVLSDISFATQPSTQNVSASIAAGLFPTTAVRLAPGDSASFRFRWTNSVTDFAESQIDNLALSGTFLDQNNSFVEINPAAVGGSVLTGDYNEDGLVNAADYTVWRDTLAAGGNALPNEGVSPGSVDQLDYDHWVAQYGTATSPTETTTVPEPLSAALTAIGCLLLFGECRFRTIPIPEIQES